MCVFERVWILLRVIKRHVCSCFKNPQIHPKRSSTPIKGILARFSDFHWPYLSGGHSIKAAFGPRWLLEFNRLFCPPFLRLQSPISTRPEFQWKFQVSSASLLFNKGQRTGSAFFHLKSDPFCYGHRSKVTQLTTKEKAAFFSKASIRCQLSRRPFFSWSFFRSFDHRAKLSFKKMTCPKRVKTSLHSMHKIFTFSSPCIIKMKAPTVNYWLLHSKANPKTLQRPLFKSAWMTSLLMEGMPRGGLEKEQKKAGRPVAKADRRLGP